MKGSDNSVSEHPPINLINLLIVDHSVSAIEHIVQTLRIAGYMVQANYSERAKEIRNLIDYRPLDLILVRQGAGLPTITEVDVMVKAAAQDIPIIAIVDDTAQQRPAELLRAGATDFFELQEPEHLLLVVRKELHYLQMRRQAHSQTLRIQETEERHRALLENSWDAIAYIHEGVHMYVNPAYLQLFGYAGQEAMEGVALMSLIMPEDRDKMKRLLRDCIKAGRAMEPVELNVLGSQGHCFPIRLSCYSTRMNDEPCFQILIHNLSGQWSASQVEEEPRTRDLLTGLYSRRFFIERLNKLCSAAKRPRGAVLYILLTDYRAINKRAGPEAVDQLASELAKLLQQRVSSTEVVARFADAVFTVYTPDSSHEATLKLGERISTEIKTHTAQSPHGLISTGSAIGICIIEQGHENASQILSQADQACEVARQAGSNQVQIYTPPALKTGTVRQEEEIVTRIREAVSKERMQLLYQPIASFQGNTSERYKAYLRILDENYKPLSMHLLAPVAERRNLMGPLDKWAILKALEALTERHGRSTTLFIRISQNSVLQRDFYRWLEKRLQDGGLPGSTLVIEVTEECAEHYFQETKALREQLRDMACGFALSHFGGRTNSKHILINLEPDYIKLDSELIEKLVKSKDETSRQALAAIAEKAREMNALVIAADIASAPQMASIWQFGVTLVQGDMVQEASPQMDFDFQQFAGAD
jgi:diguanylate cyclase (GGDEF)-like protein/PAS domain S-box-containing protein